VARSTADGTLVPYSQKGAVFVPAPVTSINPNVRPLGDGYFNDITRGYKQRAAYASIDVELIPKTLTLTAGTRYSSTKTSEVGSSVGSSGCEIFVAPPPPNPCVNHSYFVNIDAERLDKAYAGFKSRANLSWKVTEDALLYYTWSQGFRAGGFNRVPVVAPLDSPVRDYGKDNQVQAHMHRGWVSSVNFTPDSLTNNELGWKTLWLDGRPMEWRALATNNSWRSPMSILMRVFHHYGPYGRAASPIDDMSLKKSPMRSVD
jgi:iron complex outermembrane receptor protein